MLGVPQGTCFGPLGFILFLVMVFRYLKKSFLHFFILLCQIFEEPYSDHY